MSAVTNGNDPATDAGAATLVWTHSSRLLTAALNTESGNALTCTSAASQSTYGAYVQVVASLAHNVVGVVLDLKGNGAVGYTLAIATGGSGSEVNKIIVPVNQSLANSPHIMVVPIAPTVFAKGTRLSFAIANQSDGTQQTMNVWASVLEDAA